MFRNTLNIFFVLIVILFASCTKDTVNNPVGNQAPHTGVFLNPDSSISEQPSRFSMHWWGDDPDGFVIGYYFTWDGQNWTFTNANDSIFTLQIGISDTNYVFQVSAADDGGNGVYDESVVQNNINYGPEPFTDKNNNGKWDEGESFVDIGLIDPAPATIKVPIKNSAPELIWDPLTVLPDTSFPVMTFGWIASDIDGDESIKSINIALNDTSNAANIINLDGEIRNISIVAKNYSSDIVSANILISGVESNTLSEKLPGLILNGNNKLYVQAVDISGAKSGYISIPDSGKTWYVKKPKGNLLVVDDYKTEDNAPQFYASMFDSMGLSGKYDVYDFHNQTPPFESVTFLLTMKLFKYTFWYTDNDPSVDLLGSSVQNYKDAGGKIAVSMQFPQTVDLSVLAGFLPVSQDSSASKTSLIGGTKISSVGTETGYPDLELSTTLFRMKSFYVNSLGGYPVYNFPNMEMPGYVGLRDNEKKLFFIGVPLHKANGGNANVQNLLRKVLFQDFGLTP